MHTFHYKDGISNEMRFTRVLHRVGGPAMIGYIEQMDQP
jgi:hypothetical protein